MFLPRKSVQRGLVSTTSCLTGNYENDDMAIMLTFPRSDLKARIFESPASRTSLVVGFHTPETRQDAVVLPDYSSHLASVAACMSVLFGKRFDIHGLTEEHGHFRTPDTAEYASLCDHQLSFNSHKSRRAFPVRLELDEFRVVSGLFADDPHRRKAVPKLVAAARFYMRALQSAERDVEVAYLHLVTAGEILAALSRKCGLRPGKITRAFAKALSGLLDSDFFESQDGVHEVMRFRQDGVEENLRKAYSLRSVYVHNGEEFGPWISTSLGLGNVPPGEWVHPNEKMKEALRAAPTFSGLERLVRYAILKCMERNGGLGERRPVDD